MFSKGDDLRMKYIFNKGKIVINEVESREAYITAIQVLLDEYIPYVVKSINEKCGNSILPVEIYFSGKRVKESDFWIKSIKYYDLDELSSRYLIKLIEISKELKTIWADEENSAARYVAISLGNYSEKYLPLFNKYVEWHDMDHEVNEFDDIENIISKFEWCKGTIELVAIRAGIAVGQNGIEQFEKCIIEKGLKDYLQKNNSLEDFIYNLFLNKYLEHYGYLMKKSLSWVWPLSYVFDSIDEIVEMLIEDEKERDRVVDKCKKIARNYYKENSIVMS